MALGSALGALLLLGCGGVNMSDKDRRARAGATDPVEEADAAPPEEEEDAAVPVEPPEMPPPDAAVPDTAAPVPAGSFAVGTELETTANLNLRDGPGAAFAIIVEIPLGTRVKVVKISGADGWVNISFDGNLGYSSKDFLKVVP